jgi:hypothetical protein
MDLRFTSGGFHRAVMRALSVLMLTAVLLCSSCGDSGSRAVTGLTAAAPPPVASTYSDAADEVLATPAPAGIDSGLWDGLTGELASRLREVSAGYEGPYSFAEQDDFKIQLDYQGVTWFGAALHGDGNLDGVVGISDITVVAANFGRAIDYGEEYLDYSGDRQVGISDMSVLARNWGRFGDSYILEWSETENGDRHLIANVAYGDFDNTMGYSLNDYSVPVEARYERSVFVHVARRHREGLRTTYTRLTACYSNPTMAPVNSVGDLVATPEAATTFTWTTRGMMPDGNQNGITEYFDLIVMSSHFGDSLEECPEAVAVDYNSNGTVDISDLVPVFFNFGTYVTSFRIELSTVSATEGFHDIGSVDYFGGCAGFNQFGFRYYEYTLTPPQPAYWVTVTPYADDMPGITSEPLLILAWDQFI